MDRSNSNGTDLQCEPLLLPSQDSSLPVFAPKTPKKQIHKSPKSINRIEGYKKRVETIKRKAEEKQIVAQREFKLAEARRQAESARQAKEAADHHKQLLSTIVHNISITLNEHNLDWDRGGFPVQEIEGFALQELTTKLNEHCGMTISILKSICTSSAQQQMPTVVGTHRKDKIVSVAALSILQEYNQLNNKFQSLSSLFFYASGVPRQGISVISSYGNSTSYSKLIARPTASAAAINTPGSVVAVKRRKAGTLFNLSQACRELLKDIAAKRPVAVVGAGSNWEKRQVTSYDTLESGTCATAFALFKARFEDMKVSDLNAKFDNAPGITLDDIQLTCEESELHLKCMEYTILDIIVTYGGPEFQHYRLLLDEILPSSVLK
ncbi:hypothetical protein FRC11_005159 [Ceratobasidium sp. 423]|nr:hypothetical protein FRC11_005159 [Ceratobasidium sp. 423]